MTRKEMAEFAKHECENPETTVKYGVIRKFPFWNIESRQFMYVPAFHFNELRGTKKYRYDAIDEKGNKHTFEAEGCCELLTPIWAELPEGVVTLTVTALKDDGSDYALVGARTFFKLASFPEVTPKKARPYKDCAIDAFKFAFKEPFIQHWLKEGTPDPYYDLNTYPSKIISSLVDAMLSYARLFPEAKEDAMKVAVNAADWMMSITTRDDDPLADLPPTYYLDFCPDPEKYGIKTPNWDNAVSKYGTMMMIYPAAAGNMYINLSKAVNDDKYLKEAKKIGMYYVNNILDNGSWYLVLSTKTGEPTEENFIAPMEGVVPFLMNLYNETGEDCYKDTAEKAVKYAEDNQLKTYNWEGQFEDVVVASNYSNLTHYGPIGLIKYYAKYYKDDKEKIEIAKELMRFVEDQFVVWNRPTEWVTDFEKYFDNPGDKMNWHTPAGLEQYSWYVPIDGSTCHIADGFLSLYKAGCGDIYLSKALALMDQITNVQHENGKIPTHWMNTKFAESNFWYNCMFYSCRMLEEFSEYEDTKFE